MRFLPDKPCDVTRFPFHFNFYDAHPLLLFLCTGKEKGDFYELCPILLRELVYRFNDDNIDVLKANQKAFGALSKHVPAEELVTHIEFMRNLIMSMVSDARRRKGGVGDAEFLMPGFNIPKGKLLRGGFSLQCTCLDNMTSNMLFVSISSQVSSPSCQSISAVSFMEPLQFVKSQLPGLAS
jgi:hypothetical protein